MTLYQQSIAHILALGVTSIVVFGAFQANAIVNYNIGSTSDTAKFLGEAANDNASEALNLEGDINGDGYDDLLVVAKDHDNFMGAAYLFYGSATPFSSASDINLSTADAVINGESAFDYLGNDISAAGDINNDGYDDIVMAAAGEDDGGNGAGAIYIMYGKSTKFSGDISITTAEAKFLGEADSDSVGISISSGGDANGDGYDDIAVGSTGNGTGGAVYIIYGRAAKHSGSIDLSTTAKLTAEAASDNTGESVSLNGDLNGDGYDDIVVSSPHYDITGVTGDGAVYVFYGSSSKLTGTASLSTADAKFTGTHEQEQIGTDLTLAGDLDNDGYDDLLVTTVDHDGNSMVSQGIVYILYGKSAQFSGTSSMSVAEASFEGEDDLDRVGFRISYGDFNNDGYSDVFVGAYDEGAVSDETGAGYVILGSGTRFSSDTNISNADYKFRGEADGDRFGWYVSGGDSNGDGFDELLFSAINDNTTDTEAGAAHLVYLYIDIDNDGTAGSTGLLSGNDCNDGDGTVAENQTYYHDNDGDGLGDPGDTVVQCTSAPPADYVANGNDTVGDNDRDNDGSETGSDCNDSDGSVFTNQTYYQDADGDGLGDSANSISICSSTPSSGYVSDSSDTNDDPNCERTGVSKSGGSLVISCANGTDESFEPYNGKKNFKFKMSTDDQRIVVTNGKNVRIYNDDGEKLSGKQFRKNKPFEKAHYKLKVVSWYGSYDTIIVMSARNKKGKVAVMRLNSSDNLRKKRVKTLDILKKHKKNLKLETSKKDRHITAQFGKGDTKVRKTWKLRKDGELKRVN